MKWISVEDRLPNIGEEVLISFISCKSRDYEVDRIARISKVDEGQGEKTIIEWVNKSCWQANNIKVSFWAELIPPKELTND